MAITTGTALALAGGSVLGNLLGGLFGSSSQRSANETNLQIARETNQQNRELFNQQLAWQEDMWNKTNAYNDPSHQVELLQRAGINPAAVYGSGSTSPASMSSVPSAPQMQGATVNPVDYSWLGNTVSEGINAYFNNQLLSNNVTKGAADAQIAKVQAEFDLQSMKSRLIRILNDADKSSFEKEQAGIALDILRKTSQESVLQAKWQTKIMSQNYEEAINRIAESQLRQESMRIANQYAPQLSEASLKQYQANIVQMFAAARASDASAVNKYAQAALVNLQSEGVKLDNQQKDSIMDANIDAAWNAADNSYWQAQETAKKFRSGSRYSEFLPGNTLDGRSYTNYSGRKQTYRGRIERDKNGKRIIKHH